MAHKKPVLSRRTFLLSAGAGGVATAAAVIGGKAAKDATTGEGKRATSGYKLSEHISNYYRTTKV